MTYTNLEIASWIDHTLLKPDATEQAIEKLCFEAISHKFHTVCVNGKWVSLCNEILKDSQTGIAVVVGFPLGANHAPVKAFESAVAAAGGATEIDTVLSIGQLLEGNHEAVEADIREVVRAVAGQAIVKVILETGFLNDEQKVTACKISEAAGAHFVKTSTGFGPGGATVEDIRLMRGAVSSHVQVKASGGIRDLDTAIQMIEAGASRLGTSSGITILRGIASESGY
jgi:deoxyribose-phosphate aldolase